MSFDDWILALHVLSAFAYVAGVVLFWVLVVAVRQTDTPDGTIRMEPIVKIGNAAVGIGAGGTIVLGIWLAFSIGGYDIWDGWIIAALVLWLVSAEIGRRTGAAYMQGMNKAQELRTAGETGPSTELLAPAPPGGEQECARPTRWLLLRLHRVFDSIGLRSRTSRLGYGPVMVSSLPRRARLLPPSA